MDGAVPTIPEFYKGKNIFITGGTGFIGKVLIEKLLRSCPDVNALYLLMRPKKGKTEEERIKAITDLPLFDIVRQERPSAFTKIKIISGDVQHLELGLNPTDRQTLIDNIHIVVHGAASVRFDDTLKRAVILNTRGTREMCRLALEMKHIMLFMYISTTYCNTDRKVIGEKLYPPIADGEKTIKLAEQADERLLNVLTKKYMGALPNSYTFSKNLAEHIINNTCKGRIPVLIGRPSIVISTVKEPFAGWIDNFNGPCGILIASGKGLVRTMYADPDTVADFIPVDLVVKSIIIGIWKQINLTKPEEKLDVSVFNGSSNNFKPVTIQQMTDIGKELNYKSPLANILWYPDGNISTSWYIYYVKFLFYQLLPCFILDCFIKLAGHKPLLVKIQRKIFTASHALSYFILNEWIFLNENGSNMEEYLLPSDKESFGYDRYAVDVIEYFEKSLLGCQTYLLKETKRDQDNAKTHMRRMYILYVLYNIVWYGTIIWLIFFKIDILSILNKKYGSAYLYLTTI